MTDDGTLSISIGGFVGRGPAVPLGPGTTWRITVRDGVEDPVVYSATYWSEVERRVRGILADHGNPAGLPPHHDIATEDPTLEGLTPKGDGTFYGEYADVPEGWTYAVTGAGGATKGSPHGALADLIVRCWPPKPRWTASAHIVRHGDSLVACQRYQGSGGTWPDDKLAARVARLLNEDDE